MQQLRWAQPYMYCKSDMTGLFPYFQQPVDVVSVEALLCLPEAQLLLCQRSFLHSGPHLSALVNRLMHQCSSFHPYKTTKTEQLTRDTFGAEDHLRENILQTHHGTFPLLELQWSSWPALWGLSQVYQGLQERWSLCLLRGCCQQKKKPCSQVPVPPAAVVSLPLFLSPSPQNSSCQSVLSA